EKKTSRKLTKISGGSTAALQLLYRDELPAEINNFRIGEAILLGTDTTNDVEIEQLNKDTMLFCAEIIELKEKPTVPVGKIGKDAFGRDPVFVDRGIRKKVILDVGEQDIFPSGLKPIDKNIKVIHASGDHLICDVTDCDKALHLGDEIVFKMTYGCMMRAMNSEYIKKIYL
ncbi:MAG: ornithine racemase, partial [Kosmotogales bacterium]|nr:ornithine racemase [Kosmotogales bacterium]